MPSIYTHTTFACDVKNKLDKHTQNIINDKENFYKMFSQSFDNLYYYNFLSLKKGKHIRNLARHCHTQNTQEYILNIIKYIKENNLMKNNQVLCYLYGAINHYISDSNLHPYINYRTGRYFKERHEATKKYIGIHTNTEIELDAYYYNLNTGKDFKKYKIYKNINKLNFNNELINTINYAFKQTYDVENLGIIYNKSYNQSKLVYYLLMYDPYGIKLFFYKLIDFIVPTKKISCYSLYKNPVKESFFNLKHNHWCNPSDIDIISDDSWIDLYKKTCNISANLIKQSNLVLKNKIPVEKFAKSLENKSYVTGLDCKNKNIMQYFEF